MPLLETAANQMSRITNYRFMAFAIGVCVLATSSGCGGSKSATPPTEPALVVLGIGSLPGDAASEALSVSNDGLVVVGTSKSVDGKSKAVRWTQLNGMTELGFMEGGTASSARAVSADGSVIVGSGNSQSSGSAVFRWTAAQGIVQLKALGDSTLCVAGGVSGKGDVVVGTCLVAGNSAFRWTETSGMVSLGQFGGGSNQTSNAQAISADASTIVGMGHPALTGVVLWDIHSGPSTLGALPGDTSATATAVSRDGRVVVGFSIQPSQRARAFRWTRPGPMIDLGSISPGLTEIIASAVSGDGRVIVGWEKSAEVETAVIWDEFHGMRRLDQLADLKQGQSFAWKLSRATGIADDGRTIVGVGINPEGRTEGWIVTLPGAATM